MLSNKAGNISWAVTSVLVWESYPFVRKSPWFGSVSLWSLLFDGRRWCCQTEARSCVLACVCVCVRYMVERFCTAYMTLQQRLRRVVSQFWVMRLFVLLVHGYHEVYESESYRKLHFLEHEWTWFCFLNGEECRPFFYRRNMLQANMWSIDWIQNWSIPWKSKSACVWIGKQVLCRRLRCSKEDLCVV